MREPAFYPEAPAQVEFCETHISCVFLVGDYVYKIKKPVRFPFIDTNTLDKRYLLCEQEVRLNSRLSPQLYLGVWSILRGADGLLQLGSKVEMAQDDAVEYAVKMRRLPKHRMLDYLVANHAVDRSLIRAIAAKISEFHASASSEHGWRYGCSSALAQGIEGELGEISIFQSDTLTAGQYSAIEKFLHRFIRDRGADIDRRARSGRVCEGHGDLRAEHICFDGTQILVIDCVEFNERLRYGDVAAEIAFLAMDLERLGAASLADEFMSAYIAISGDWEIPRLIPFYICYRACVRGKVESLRGQEEELDTAQRDHARRLAGQYFTLAAAYAEVAQPALVVVCGLSGTGKSTLARKLELRTGFARLNSDEVRKQLAGVAVGERRAEAHSSGLYSDEFTKITYDKLLQQAEESLRDQVGVLLDATFKRRSDRERAVALSRRMGVPILFLECIADHEVVQRRLRHRQAIENEVSDATIETYLKQRDEFQPLTELDSTSHLVVNTAQNLDVIMGETLVALVRLANRDERI
jgi:aminoglycoside phosphotransferase family enzyme/adenylate kinase family enzyme